MENKNLNKLKLDLIDPDTERAEISTWDYIFKNQNGLKKIYKNILGKRFKNLTDFINQVYCSYLQKSDYPAIVTCKNDSDEIVGLSAITLYDVSTSPKLTVKYILTRPDKQHMGIANFMLSHLSEFIEKLSATKISSINANVSIKNKEGLNLLSKCGFCKGQNFGKDYVFVEKNNLALESDSDYPRFSPFI